MRLWKSEAIDVEPTCIYMQVQYINARWRHLRILFKPAFGLAFLCNFEVSLHPFFNHEIIFAKYSGRTLLMLKIFMYAFPTMVLILGSYLLLYKDSVSQVLSLESHRIIIMFSITYYLLAILGFILVLKNLETMAYIWIFATVLFTFFMVFVFYMIYSQNLKHKK